MAHRLHLLNYILVLLEVLFISCSQIAREIMFFFFILYISNGGSSKDQLSAT
jgi:hypothetical protein